MLWLPLSLCWRRGWATIQPSAGRRRLLAKGNMISRVFVVDDDRLIASTTTAILELNGYDAHSFVNPLEALEAVRTVGPPDLVIADVIMPGLSGVDLAGRLKEECPNC